MSQGKFTDDDLARFKGCDSVDGWHRIEAPKWDALIARLEAAEKVASYTEKYAPKVDELQGLIEAWHKACGK